MPPGTATRPPRGVWRDRHPLGEPSEASRLASCDLPGLCDAREFCAYRRWVGLEGPGTAMRLSSTSARCRLCASLLRRSRCCSTRTLVEWLIRSPRLFDICSCVGVDRPRDLSDDRQCVSTSSGATVVPQTERSGLAPQGWTIRRRQALADDDSAQARGQQGDHASPLAGLKRYRSRAEADRAHAPRTSSPIAVPVGTLIGSRSARPPCPALKPCSSSIVIAASARGAERIPHRGSRRRTGYTPHVTQSATPRCASHAFRPARRAAAD